ncbi:MAG: efflux RND transporter periplasmic adaptor subunit [Ignavibacteriales bacterium]|nr:efflux RND transporter periplasmic adaptor subunit [Ignavibacteriales bacterium]
MKKTFLYILFPLILIGGGGYYYFGNAKSEEVKYRTEKISRGDITIQVRATGTINPKRIVQVGSQVSGTISKLFADFNSQVHEGEIIAMIDSTFLYASVKEAEANLERTKAQVNEAKRTLTRMEELFKKELVSKADYDAAQTSFETATAQQKQSQAALDRAMVNLRYSVIRAPIDGIVVSRDVDVGQTVAASLQAPKIFSIANDLKLMQVEASVDEADIGQIQEGQTVSFTVDAYPDEEFNGTVTQVRIAPVTVQNVVTYTVIIEVPNEQLKLRPGMTATVSVLVQKKENVLRVPALALRFQPPMEVLEKFQDKEKENDSMKRNDGVMEKGGNGGKSDSSTSKQNDNGERRMRVEKRNSDNDERREGNKERGERGERREWNREGMNNREGGSGEQGKERKTMKRNFARIWILENGKDLKPVRLRTGITDNRFIEIFSEELKEGDEIILGINGNETSSMQGGQSQNPFAPRMPGGGGGGRRGF